jgi:hypothetical protein
MNGAYDLETPAKHLAAGSNSASQVSTGQSILLAVFVTGSDIYLYANNQFLAHVVDSSTSSGAFGLLAVDFSNPTTAVFTNIKIRKYKAGFYDTRLVFLSFLGRGELKDEMKECS